MHGGTILIVEDDLTFQKWLRDTVLREIPRLVVREATDGKQALKEVKDFNPRIVIMDIGLPGRNGIEITKAIKSICPSTKFIFLTNYDDPEYRQAAEKLDVDCFLSKRSTKKAEIISLDLFNVHLLSWLVGVYKVIYLSWQVPKESRTHSLKFSYDRTYIKVKEINQAN